MPEIPDNPDEIVLLMLEDIVSKGFIARQAQRRSVSAWLPYEAIRPMAAAIGLPASEARASAILDVLDEHVNESVVHAFLAWYKEPKLSYS